MSKLKILILLLFLPIICFSQKTIVLDSKSRTAIVYNINQLLIENYVFPDTALKMSSLLKKRLKEGAYNNITDAVAFSDALTLDLYSIYHDIHLQLLYHPQENNTILQQGNTINSLKSIKQANFGFNKIEILNGNIGYLKITHFWADSVNGLLSLKAALQFLAYTDALIIDVRDCGGGSQETVKMICGYFLEKSTHINDMYDRASNTITEYWTKPDSSFAEFTKMPLYILTNKKTFSASEEFCYDLQILKRATIVGETTGGGAHGTFSRSADYGFMLSIPYSRAINPLTKSNWEKTGVKPDIEVSSAKALETAGLNIFDKLISAAKHENDSFNLKWDLELFKSINNPFLIDTATLKKYAGIYGDRTFTFENGKLFYQRAGRPKYELEAMSAEMMKGIGNNYFKVEFIKGNSGKVEWVKVFYQDNRIETSFRNDK